VTRAEDRCTHRNQREQEEPGDEIARPLAAPEDDRQAIGQTPNDQQCRGDQARSTDECQGEPDAGSRDSAADGQARLVLAHADERGQVVASLRAMRHRRGSSLGDRASVRVLGPAPSPRRPPARRGPRFEGSGPARRVRTIRAIVGVSESTVHAHDIASLVFPGRATHRHASTESTRRTLPTAGVSVARSPRQR